MNLQIAEKFISPLNEEEFRNIALGLFKFHYSQNKTYSAFCTALSKSPHNVHVMEDIPFLPISFFKSHKILTPPDVETQLVFESSGTSGTNTSRHYVSFASLYQKSFTKGFEFFFGKPEQYAILSLLPSYLERNNSSLVFMMNHLAELSQNPHSGFYLDQFDLLYKKLKMLRDTKQKTILLGVSFALLDFAASFADDFPQLIVIETGGMKGKREEITREELHGIISNAWGVEQVYSEYGMTELLSQAWSSGKGLFKCPPWMKVLVRDPSDPLSLLPNGKTGGINVIDLANAFSCPFIAVDDTGRRHDDGSFEVTGRFDFATIRGCNTMIG
jgi:phenylacetate-coenzyme A ligase PaaK-like adenylate-forming protein